MTAKSNESGRYDVVVIGGGIQGAGVAQAAAASGYDVLLLEKTAPAAETSGRSSKLIHGGLRYLESAQFGLVRESLRDRNTLLRIAPDLVRPVDFYLPIYRYTRRRPWMVRLGLSVYWLLGGMNDAARFETVPREGWSDLDGLDTEGLQAVFRYRDAQTDDTLLTRAVLRSAGDLGAEILFPARFVSAERTGEEWDVLYATGGGQSHCRCRVLVNAAGAWTNDVHASLRPPLPPIQVDLVQGSHIEVAGRVERGFYYAEAPTDHRAVFVMPWYDRILVGTTETPFHGDPSGVIALDGEVDYLLSVLRHYFPGKDGAVLDRWAGLRVLPRAHGIAFGRSREVLLSCDRPRRPRIITVCGGKLTAFRSTAERVMAKLRGSLPRRAPRADTASLLLTRPADGD